MHLQCIAYRDDGTICRQPATILDVQRGGMVCIDHPPLNRHMDTSADAEEIEQERGKPSRNQEH